MHILNVLQCTNLGGMEQASLRLMRALQGRGHSFRVVSVNALGALAPLLAAQGIPAAGVPFRGKYGWRTHLKLRRALRASAADALLMTGPTLTGLLALYGLPVRKRILAVHFHHTGVKAAWAWKMLYRLARRQAGALTFPSDFIRREAEALLPALAPLSHTIRLPLIMPAERALAAMRQARAALGVPADAFVVGNAGWLIERKRFDVFLRVAGRVAARCPRAVFLIAGDGDQRQKLERLAEELGLAARVRWLGWQENLERFYLSLDVLLFNSDWDAVGLTPQEAMSYGVPVVASVVHGGLKEVIHEPDCGLVLDEHNEEALSAHVLRCLAQAGYAQALGRAGRARVAALSDMDGIARQHEALWEAQG